VSSGIWAIVVETKHSVGRQQLQKELREAQLVTSRRLTWQQWQQMHWLSRLHHWQLVMAATHVDSATDQSHGEQQR